MTQIRRIYTDFKRARISLIRAIRVLLKSQLIYTQ